MRDDINKLPLPREAKAYARRKGLKSMMQQPAQFLRVNAALTNPGKPNIFKNYDVGKVQNVKEHADALVMRLLDA